MKSTKLKLHFIPIDDTGFHIKIKALINGKTAWLIVDTGASKTVLDKNKIEAYLALDTIKSLDQLSSGLGTNTMESGMAEVEKIKLGGLLITKQPVAVLNLENVDIAYSQLQLPLVQGILGGDILQKYHAVINYKKQYLKLYHL